MYVRHQKKVLKASVYVLKHCGFLVNWQYKKNTLSMKLQRYAAKEIMSYLGIKKYDTFNKIINRISERTGMQKPLPKSLYGREWIKLIAADQGEPIEE